MIHTPVFNGDGHFCPRCNLSWDQGEPEPPDCLTSEWGYGTQPLTIQDTPETRRAIDEWSNSNLTAKVTTVESNIVPEDLDRFILKSPSTLIMGGTNSTTRKQVGGTHYLKLKIDPNRFCMRNHLDACIHGILKYVTRHRDRNGIEDLYKARHYVEIRETYAIDLEPAKYEAITMLEYVTQNQICVDDAEVMYRLEAYYRAIGHAAARICADRLVDEIERLIRKTYLTVDAT
jgi:hypothetical protein